MIRLVRKRGKQVLVELDYQDFVNLHCLALAAQKLYEEKLQNGELSDDERSQAETVIETATLLRSMVAEDFLSDVMANI